MPPLICVDLTVDIRCDPLKSNITVHCLNDIEQFVNYDVYYHQICDVIAAISGQKPLILSLAFRFRKKI